MRRSKLETYIDILNMLSNTGPLKLTLIMHKTNFAESIVKAYLEFLIKQGLVEERTVKKISPVFAVTQRGITMLKHFQELVQEPITMEEQSKTNAFHE
jgi:predicted transcriptional regulator